METYTNIVGVVFLTLLSVFVVAVMALVVATLIRDLRR